jgi:hypothetical protein
MKIKIEISINEGIITQTESFCLSSLPHYVSLRFFLGNRLIWGWAIAGITPPLLAMEASLRCPVWRGISSETVWMYIYGRSRYHPPMTENR